MASTLAAMASAVTSLQGDPPGWPGVGLDGPLRKSSARSGRREQDLWEAGRNKRVSEYHFGEVGCVVCEPLACVKSEQQRICG